MNKKMLIFILLLCSALLSFILLICSGFLRFSIVSQEEYITEQEKENAALNTTAETVAPEDTSGIQMAKESYSGQVFDENTVLSQLDIKKYHYYSSYGSTEFLIIKNNSEFDLSIDIDGIFYDEENNLIGADNTQYARAFEPGQEMAFGFYNEEDFNSFQYQINVSEEDVFLPVLSDLAIQIDLTNDKAIVSVTNRGEKTAVLVRYYVIFIKDDQIIDYAWGGIGDNDDEMKPGKTEIFQESSYGGSFDSVQVYLSGSA